MNSEELRIYLRTIADTTGAKQTEQSLKGVQGGLRASTGDLVRFAGALTGVNIGLSLFAEAGQQLNAVVARAAEQHVNSERIMRGITASYGRMSGEWVAFAKSMSRATGESQDAILQASLNARSLMTNFGLSVEQARKLISLSEDLSTIRGIDLEGAFQRVEGAMRGEAEASEYLGVTLGDEFLQHKALDGALRSSWQTLSLNQKSQVRYNELLRQTTDFEGLATKAADSLGGAQKRSKTATEDFNRTLGSILAPTLKDATNLFTDLTAASTRFLQGFQQQAGAAPAEQLAVGAKEGQSSIDALSDSMRRLRIETRAQQEQGRRWLEQLNEEFTVQARNVAQLAYFDRYDAAVRDLTNLLQHQVDLQNQAIQLTAEEARIKMGLLPAQERLAALQRDISESQIRARMAALPATEALEDLRYEEQRARLISQNRAVSAAERIDARRALRDIGRRAPGVELAALVAGRPATLAGRAAERVGMQQQLFDIASGRALAGVGAGLQGNQLAQAIGAAAIPAQQQALAEIVADGMAKGFERMEPRTIEVHIHDVSGAETIFKQLIEAGKQAQGPTVIQQSGVRRG